MLHVSEVLHEDMPFLVVFVIALATLAAFLMLCMWLWNKLYRLIQAWVQRRCLPGNKLHLL